MYTDVWEDPTTNIPAGTSHTSEALDLIKFLHTGIFLFADSVPGNTVLFLEASGTKEEPSATHWKEIYSTQFRGNEPFLIEKRTAATYIRYRLEVGNGGNVEGFVGTIFRKGW